MSKEPYSLNSLPDLGLLQEFRKLLADFVKTDDEKYPKIIKICGICEEWNGIGSEGGSCGEGYGEKDFDAKGCRKWIANCEIVDYLLLFGLLGTIPKVSQCHYYVADDYKKAQRGEWNCLFWEKGGCTCSFDEGEKGIQFSNSDRVLCPDQGKKKGT